jgi:hypothetical protein
VRISQALQLMPLATAAEWSLRLDAAAEVQRTIGHRVNTGLTILQVRLGRVEPGLEPA